MRACTLLFAVLFITSTCSLDLGYAQIEMNDSYELGEPIEVGIRVPDIEIENMKPDEYDIRWRTDDAATGKSLPGGYSYLLHVWALPGDHVVTGSVAYIVEGKPRMYTDTRQFKVEGGNIVAPPVIETKTLRDLVNNDAQADALAVIYATLRDAKFESLAEFEYVHTARLKARQLDNNGAASSITARLARAKDVAMLPAILSDIVKGLGGSVMPGPGPEQPDKPDVSSVTQITYVYEERDGSPPQDVLSAINKLRVEKKINATQIDDDVKNADGNTPLQYKVALETAKQTGIPVVISQSGERVIKTFVRPTGEQVWSLAP